MVCTSSPDEICSYFIEVVDDAVGSLSIVPARGCVVYPAHIGVKMLNWRMIDSAEIIRIDRGFKATTSPDFYGVTLKM